MGIEKANMFAWKHSILMAIQKPISFSSIKLLSTSCCLRQDSPISDNYYDILDVPRFATQKQIREAYIKKSRELHPDVQDPAGNKDGSNAKFAVVNAAYEVLSKPKERREYTEKLSRGATIRYSSTVDVSNSKGRVYDLSQMSPEERAKFMGYHVARQRANNDTYIVAGLCVVIMIVGYSIHYRIASITAEKHSKNLEEMSNQLQAEYNSVKLRAMQAALPEGKYGNASIRASIVRNDNEAGDHVREYDERMERLHKLRQRRAAKKLIIEENEKVKEAQEEKDNNEAQNHAVATN